MKFQSRQHPQLQATERSEVRWWRKSSHSDYLRNIAIELAIPLFSLDNEHMLGLWCRIQRHRWLVFLGWYLCLTLLAIVPPRSPQLSVVQRAAYIVASVVTLLFAASLCAYFVEAWKRQRGVSNRGAYTAWVLFESVIGVPFALSCAAGAFAALWIAVR